MFTKEADIWSSLQHPHIVKLFGACHVGNPFFVCELASNGSLVSYIDDEKNRHKAWKCLFEAALGLSYLHGKQIVHLDIKGVNILVGNDGTAKLTDFGLSYRKADLQLTGDAAMVGALCWKAPEFISGESSGSCECDVYSFGMTIYEVVTQRLPYGTMSDATIRARVKRKIHKLPSRPDEMNEDQWDLFKHMCSTNRNERVGLDIVIQKLKTFADEAVANYQHHQWELEKQRRISLLRAAQPSSAAVVSLDQVKHLCDTMEARSMCHHIYSRLFNLGEFLSATHIIDREPIQNGYAAIVVRFHSFLVQFGNKSAISRILTRRITENTCQKLHEDQDDLIRLCEVDGFKVDFLWRARFMNDSMVLGSALQSVQDRPIGEGQHTEEQVEALTLLLSKQNHFEGQNQWKNELVDTDAQAKALTSTMYDFSNRAGKYDPQELRLIRQIFSEVSRYSKSGIPTLPSWFLPPHEVEIGGNIDRGSHGSVHRGTWMETSVVIKSVIFQENSNVENREMFLKEADLWFRLQHPHIVKLYGACHVGNPFFVCEFASNRNLPDYTYKNPKKIWKCLYEAALGLWYLHTKRKIVHRDIKGSNILVCQDGAAKLADFGLSCLAVNLPPSDNAEQVGAIGWKAPEIISGESSGSFAADVYSFGMTIIEIATQSYPWRMMPDVTVRHKVVKLRELPKQPAELSNLQWNLIKQMCSPDPAERIEMATVVQELKEFAALELGNYLQEQCEYDE